MANILNYAKSNTKSFEEVPFNAVDSLILSTLAYIDFDFLFKKEYKLVIKDVPLAKINKKLITIREADKYIKLFNYVHDNPRYRDGIFRDYIEIASDSDETHFNAMTFSFNDFSYIAYMGTGASLVDWKEDFKLAYKKYVPAQRYAKEYLDKMLKHLSGDIYVGGHSKGGNLACYAATYTKLFNKFRIKEVFNHDGPGFNKKIYNSFSYRSIKNKINKTVPQSSLVGMLFYSRVQLKIIKSSGFSLLQHSPFTWLVKNNDFIYLEDRTWDSKYFDKTITDWLDSLSKKEIEIFVEALFDILSKVDYETIDITRYKFFNFIKVVKKGTNDLDPETKEIVLHVLDRLKYYRKINFKIGNDNNK